MGSDGLLGSEIICTTCWIPPAGSYLLDPTCWIPPAGSHLLDPTCWIRHAAGDWFLYSDDDMIISNRGASLRTWWDYDKGAQRLYLDYHNSVHGARPRSKNNWEQARSTPVK